MKHHTKAQSGSKAPSKRSLGLIGRQAGQVVIEYVLLMVILASLGAVIMRSFVSRDSSDPGILVAKWNNLLKTVAQDNPED